MQTLLKKNTVLSLEDLNRIIACPMTKQPLKLIEGELAKTHDGKTVYQWVHDNFDLIPENYKSSELWDAWEQLQINGQISYQEAPAQNLGIGPRPDAVQFGNFCEYRGLVLDVGCGPQQWPGYFLEPNDETTFVGIDPLIMGSSPRYRQLRALGEYLPLLNNSFDQVMFSTSLDHFVNPLLCLKEAKRVCKSNGVINLWMGEKAPNTPNPSVSPEWYLNLVKPDKAEDPFHFKRLFDSDVQELILKSNLTVLKHENHVVDEYRNNHFYKLKPNCNV
jgi:SAM-dependent methyltransferase